jgi:hypothetical protein
LHRIVTPGTRKSSRAWDAAEERLTRFTSVPRRSTPLPGGKEPGPTARPSQPMASGRTTVHQARQPVTGLTKKNFDARQIKCRGARSARSARFPAPRPLLSLRDLRETCRSQPGRTTKNIGGPGRNRTGIRGFAVRCITTLPPDPRVAGARYIRRRTVAVKPVRPSALKPAWRDTTPAAISRTTP